MIPREMAEGLLGIDVEKLPVDRAMSVANSFEIGVARLTVTLEQTGRRESFEAPFQIPLNQPGFPSLPLIGREPLFHLFDVSFRMAYTPNLGKFTLKKVTKTRDAERYTVGGAPIRNRSSR